MLNQSLLTYLIYMYVLFYQVDFMVNNFYELFCLGKLLWLMIDILLITMNESRCYGGLNEKCPHRFMYFILCSQGVVLFEIMYPTDSGVRQMLYVTMRTLGVSYLGPALCSLWFYLHLNYISWKLQTDVLVLNIEFPSF